MRLVHLLRTGIGLGCRVKQSSRLLDLEQTVVVQLREEIADELALHCQLVDTHRLLQQVEGDLGGRLRLGTPAEGGNSMAGILYDIVCPD